MTDVQMTLCNIAKYFCHARQRGIPFQMNHPLCRIVIAGTVLLSACASRHADTMHTVVSPPSVVERSSAGATPHDSSLVPAPSNEGSAVLRSRNADPFLPKGVNQPCNNHASDPTPVVLIHGTFANARRAFSTLAPLLQDNGHCVYALNYGKRSPIPAVYATGDMEESAAEILGFIDTVRRQTGARQVDVIGHSQGGTLALYLAKQKADSGLIRRIVALSPSTRGTETAKILPTETRCAACNQQAPNSAFIRRLHEGPVNPGRIPVLILGTENDRVVTPVASQFIAEPGVLNLKLQELFPGRVASHSGILHDRDAMQYVTEWLRASTGGGNGP